MSEIRRMVFTAEKESFIARVLIEKTMGAGILCDFVPFEINKINGVSREVNLFTLYMDEGWDPKEDAVHFLTERLEETGGRLIVAGEKLSVESLCSHVPGEIIYDTFIRPIDNSAYVGTVADFFDKFESGDLKKKILIVDDDPQYLMLVREWLKDEYKVSVASSGMQAIKFVAKNKVDLILLDHEMPVTGGPQVLEMLRSESETSSIPVIFLTGKGDKQSVMQVLSLNPEGYLLKGISREELLTELKKFFGIRSLT